MTLPPGSGLLLRLVPRGDRGEVAGDLAELHGEHRRRAGRLRATARTWVRILEAGLRLRSHGLRTGIEEGGMEMGQGLRDLAHGLRGFRRNPSFTAITVVTLGLGIGAVTAVWSVVSGVLLEPLPYPDSDRIVSVLHGAPGLDADVIPNSRATYVAYDEASRTLDDLALYAGFAANLTGAGDPVRIEGRRVTPSLFEVLRVSPALGRSFTAEEGREGAASVILSHPFWLERYGGDPDVLGRAVELDGERHTIVGVMPEGFAFPHDEVRLWLPLAVDPTDASFTGFNEMGIGRLAPGATPEDVTRELDAMIPGLPERYPRLSPALLDQSELHVRVQPYVDDVVGDVREALWVLLGMVGFVLLIACANVANLMLVRAEGRSRDVAVRSALGADRGDLVRHFLAESAVLAVAGGVLGVALAAGGLELLRSLGVGALPRLEGVGIDAPVLLATAVVTAGCAAVFGLIPVVRHRHVQPADGLRDASRSSTGGRRTLRARELLVAGQVALALVLLVGSGLMVRSFDALRDVDPGFDAKGVLTFGVALPSTGYDSQAEIAAFHRSLLERIRGLPGVEAAGGVTRLPLGGMSGINAFYDPADPPAEGELPAMLETRAVTPGYFEALGIPLLRGRAVQWSDGGDGSTVLLVSPTAAERIYGHVEPVGSEVVDGMGGSDDSTPSRVVGVVGDVHNASLVEEPMGTVYYAPDPGERTQRWLTASMSYVVRTGGEPLDLVPAVRAAVADLDPAIPVSSISTLEERVASARRHTVFTLTLLGIAAVVGLVLGAVGLYGVISHLTARRSREIGLRMALGARGDAVRGMVLRRGMGVTALGAVVGLAGAWAASRSMGSLLYGVDATDPLTYGGVTALLVGVAFVATWIPAWRASTVDPVEALRSE